MPVIERPMELPDRHPEVHPRNSGMAHATVLINGKKCLVE